MEKRLRYEITVGLFVIVAAIILGYISLKISRMRVKDGIDVGFLFSHACGLVKNAPVAVSGVEVGYIKDLKQESGKALITARVSSSAELRKDLKATIRAKSLLGEPYLELIPGGSGAPLLKNGDLVVNTSTPVQIDQMVSWMGSLLREIDPAEAARFFKALTEDPAATHRIIMNLDELLKKGAALDSAAMKQFIQELKIKARLF